MSQAVLIDTDALLGIFNTKDALHKRALAVLTQLDAAGQNIFVLPTTLSEFALVATHHIGYTETKEVLMQWYKNFAHLILEIDNNLTETAFQMYNQQTSKEESLFDCFVMSAANRYKFSAIFSFDKGYQKPKNHFVLAEDLVSAHKKNKA